MTAPRTNIIGIQTEERKVEPDKPLTQQTIKEPAIKSPVGIQAPPKAPPVQTQQPTVQPIQRPQPVSTPAPAPVQPVQIKPITPVVDTQEKPLPSVKPVQVTEPVVKPTSPVTAPPQRGIDFKEQEKILQQQVEQQVARAEEQGAIEQRNIQNTFSHFTARGKDSGFINARNMAAARSANRGVRDAKFQINTEFQKNMFDIAKQKAQQEANFNEEAYVNWISNANDQINAFADAGDYEGAAEMAAAYAEVDDNNVFKKWSNPQYVDLMQKSFDANNVANFNEIRDQVNSIAINSALDGFNMKQSKDAILTLLDQNELGKKEMIDFVSFVDPTEYEGLGVPEENRDILDDFRNGTLDASNQAVRDAFADLYIRELQDSRKQEELADRFDSLPSSITNNPIGAELHNAIIEDSAGSIDWEPTEGFNVDRFSVFGREFDIANDADKIRFVPGLDVLFEDVNGEPYTEQYTPEMGRDLEVEGLPNNAGYYTDIYRDYISGKTKEYERLADGSLEKQNLGNEVMNFDEFLDKLRDAEAITPEKETEVIEGRVKDGMIGDIRVSELSVDPDQMTEKVKDDYLNILEADNVNDLSYGVSKMKTILAQGAKSDDTYNYGIIDDLIEQNKLSEVGEITDSVTGRDNLITDTTHALYGENMENLLKSLNDKNEGYVAIGGDMYKVKATAGRDKQSSGAETYHPVVVWSLTPVTEGVPTGGETITARSRFSTGTMKDVQKNVTGGRFHERDAGRAEQHAQSAINRLKGGQ